MILNQIVHYLLPLRNDVPKSWGISFQDGATPSFEGIVELHDQIFFYMIVILFGVSWMLFSVIRNYSNKNFLIIHKYTNHGTLIELIWTITPAFILLAIAFPSFKLLYLMDEVIDPAMTLKVNARQWYWTYEYSDFLNDENESIEFDSYLIPEEDLELGQLRLLDVDQRVILPIDTHIRFVITSGDVLHDFAVPALGLKMDCIPGRLNQSSVIIQREGTFYGQCSEICGQLHSAMPIVVQSVSIDKFISWLDQQS